ncbi:predicted protein [Thalassiosira pseudonana CCMP1335]|uniref:PDZ domain-containing protein n=1 Tax=Thalassiosira pseudonana TaxID=35128 RepID=B5YNR5_THAPS|nr:predicted protein [Thalassiosira pseudonana CCMP1335]ACI65031.1 predicted protein [Thalassiosira pseudonana CCMP1335]
MILFNSIVTFIIGLFYVQLSGDAFITPSCHDRPSSPSQSPSHDKMGKKRHINLSLQMISSGFSFNDGEQTLISVQKPLGIILEQEQSSGPIRVAKVIQGSAADAGVKEGDVLLAVQNASVENADLEEVLVFIGNAPRVLNLRLLRKESS